MFTEQYIEGMVQSQNTAVLWPNGLRLLIYWFDNRKNEYAELQRDLNQFFSGVIFLFRVDLSAIYHLLLALVYRKHYLSLGE
jgi:hypothetical protein